MRAPGNLDLVACIKRARRKTKALRRAFSPWTAEKPSSETFGGKNVQKGTATPCVLKDSSSRARALSRQKDTEISRNAFLGISFYVEGCQTHLAGFLPLKMFFLTIAVIFSLFLTNFKDAKQ